MRLPKVLAACVGFLLLVSTISAFAVSGGRRATDASPLVFSSKLLNGKGSSAARGSAASGLRVAGSGDFTDSSLPSTTTGAPQTPTPTPQALPVPSAGNLPAVGSAGAVHTPDAVVLVQSPISGDAESKLDHLRGVQAATIVDTGTVNLAGAKAVTFGVNPSTFRTFTPQSSAVVDRLWQYLAGGALVSSYDMATDQKLQLGVLDSLTPAGGTNGSVQGWMGAFASLGLPGVDLLVDQNYSSPLGLAPRTGAVISAPTVDGVTLRNEIQQALPGATVELLRLSEIPQITGPGLDNVRRASLIAAALSQVGKPYVWGAAGPGSFDCSGLVQWAYRQAGVLMPRTAAEQFLTGQHIPLSSAAPGDLLFWTYDPNDPTFVDHVAIYLGNGMMVVAPHTGLNVEVVPVPTDSMAGVVRVVLRG
ncbi:MAG TPA: C40 family peptidase [Acidimicrobiales bacterium]